MLSVIERLFYWASYVVDKRTDSSLKPMAELSTQRPHLGSKSSALVQIRFRSLNIPPPVEVNVEVTFFIRQVSNGQALLGHTYKVH